MRRVVYRAHRCVEQMSPPPAPATTTTTTTRGSGGDGVRHVDAIVRVLDEQSAALADLVARVDRLDSGGATLSDAKRMSDAS